MSAGKFNLQPKGRMAGSVLLLASFAGQAPAGQADPTGVADPALIDGPPAPVPTAVMTLDQTRLNRQPYRVWP